MSEWKIVPLESVARIERDGINPSDIVSGTAYVGLENIETGGAFVNVRDVDSGELASNKFLFTEQHVLYGKLRPYLAKIARPEFRGICSTDILPILPGKNLDRNYLTHFLRQPSMINLATARSAGANLPRLSPKVLAEFQIPLPPIEDQKRIAAILDQAEALRSLRRQSIGQLDALARSVFLEMFGDPVTNPKGWKNIPFGEVCETRLGKMLDQKKQTEQHNRKYLRNANVRWFHFNLSDLSLMDFDETDRKILTLEYGDLLICEGGEPGRAAVWKNELEECYFQKALHRARPNLKLANSIYLAWLLWFFAHCGGLGDHVTSATIAHLTGEKLKAMKIPVPPLALQQEFADRIGAIEALKTTHRESLAKMDSLFASLQHRAFQGEL